MKISIIEDKKQNLIKISQGDNKVTIPKDTFSRLKNNQLLNVITDKFNKTQWQVKSTSTYNKNNYIVQIILTHKNKKIQFTTAQIPNNLR